MPAVGWSTSLFTVAQAGLHPVLVDGGDSLCLEGEWDRPVMAVHLLLPGVGQRARHRRGRLWRPRSSARRTESGSHWGRLGLQFFLFAPPQHHRRRHGEHRLGSHRQRCAERSRPWMDARALRPRSHQRRKCGDRSTIFVRERWVQPPSDGNHRGHGCLSGAEARWICRQAASQSPAWCAAIADLNLPLRVFPELPGTEHAAFAFPMLPPMRR